MKTVQHTSTLLYYDGPQIIEAADPIGGHYIAVMVEMADGRDQYLVTGAAPERLRQFRVGSLDLRSLLVESGDSEWYLATCGGEQGQTLSLTPQYGPISESPFLPEPGFVLRDRAVESVALKEAIERNNLVLEVAVDPPETASDHRIRGETLAKLLLHVQSVVKHAYRAAARALGPVSREDLDSSSWHQLDVVIPAVAGSFKIVLESSNRPDLLGFNEVSRGLTRIDQLFSLSGSPEETLALVKTNRGRLAGSYLRLLRFLVESRTGLRYSWAQPDQSKLSSGSISEAQAELLVEALSGVSDLGEEAVELVGVLEKADVSSGDWRIRTEEGAAKGKTGDGGPSLTGLRIGSRYHFHCLEKTEESEVSSQEKHTLFLVEYRALK